VLSARPGVVRRAFTCAEPEQAALKPVRSPGLTRGAADERSALFVFVAATLVMVTVGIVDRCWVLAPVMLVDLATTFGVVAYITRLFADDGEAPRSTPR
jgi:hypothetical protein